MASKRFITTAIWGNEDIQELSGIARWVFVYLCAARESAICGYYRATIADISRDIAFPESDVTKALVELEERTLIVYDKSLVFVRNMAKQQEAETLPSFHGHLHKQFTDLNKPGNRAFEAFMERFGEIIQNYKKKPKKAKSNKQTDVFANPSEGFETLPKGNQLTGKQDNSLKEGSGEKTLPDVGEPVTFAEITPEAPPLPTRPPGGAVGSNTHAIRGDTESLEYFVGEWLHPDDPRILPMENRILAPLRMSYPEPQIRDAVLVCAAEGWRSMASLRDYLAGKLKPKGQRFQEQQQSRGQPAPAIPVAAFKPPRSQRSESSKSTAELLGQ
ncbi:MAG: hypothetical protein JSS75_07255 [Bacteroidetes bacterium]|nr:hypothetical protein [Bacteroidota bacterium]